MTIHPSTSNIQPNTLWRERGTPRIRLFRSRGQWSFRGGCWILVFLLVVLPAHSRVFWRWSGRAEAGRSLEALGATRAYAAPVVLNGGRGFLSVYGLDVPLGTALRHVGRALNVAFDAPGEASMVVETIDIPSGRLRLVAIAPPDITRTLFCLIEQSRAEADRSSSPPATSDLPNVPVFPGSAPLFVATNEKARADLVVSVTVAPPETVRRFYREQLTAAGWLPGLPGAAPAGGAAERDGRRAETAIYLRGQNICCVQIAERAGQTQITVFHKELSNKPRS